MPMPAAADRAGATFAPPDPHRIKLYWLLKLHWGAIVAQVGAVLALPEWLGITLPTVPLLLLIGIQAGAMLFADVWTRRRETISERAIAMVMLWDAAVLTAMLYAAGGYANPFSVLYVVNVALAAVMLRAAWSWAMLIVSLVAFGSLFLVGGDGGHHYGLPEMEHDELMALHMRGLWFALAMAAGFIVYIVQRVTRELDAREQELTKERSLGMRREKIASLATLAAGAAHELSTPLSVIAVVTGELQRLLADSATAQEDLQLIKQQIARCQTILHQMAAHAGENAGEPLVSLTLSSWSQSALENLPGRERVAVCAKLDLAAHSVSGPARGLVRSLRSLLKNALQASPGDSPVELRFRLCDGGAICADVVDRGPGIPEEIMGRIGEPFFTTKVPGEGMGLGLFLTRALAEQLGGSLDLDSIPGKGTIATLRLPAALAFKTGVAA